MDYQGSLIQLKGQFKNIEITNDKQLLTRTDKYDFIVIDTPPYLSNELPRLFLAADLILIPTKAGILDVLAISSTIDLIANEKMTSKALIVFNMIKPNTTLTKDIIELIVPFNINIASCKLGDLVAYTRSVACQGVSHDLKAQTQLDNLTEEILTLLL